MKKFLIYILTAATMAAGCKKTYDDNINGQTPDQRVAAAMTAYQQKLTQSPYGWIMVETTTGTAFNQGVSQDGPVASFAYYMQFNDSNKVAMFSDFDTSMAGVAKTSDFRVKSLQRPALIFDTYSYLHVPCDPDPNISKSPFGFGYGWGTDFEFSFADNIDASKLGDTIHLTGNLNSAGAVLIKATKAQHDAYYAGALKANMVNWGNILNYFKRVTGGSTQFELTPGLSGAKSVDINWLDASNNLQSASTSLYFTATSVNLVTPATIGTQTIGAFNNVVWNAGTSTITATVGTTAVTIAGSTAPLKNDVNAPKTWWNKSATSGDYWISANNFHVNGVDDAYKISALPGFYYTLYWAKYSATYDLAAPIFLSGNSLALNYGAAYRLPTFTAAGTVIFPYLGILGTVPAAATAAFTPFRQKIAEATGYYLILKEDKLTYDMVNVADAKAWIQWSWIF